MKLLLIDIKATDKRNHLFDDDLFWALNVPNRIDSFSIASSKASIDNILRYFKNEQLEVNFKHTVLASSLRIPKILPGFASIEYLIKLLSISRKGYDSIIFQSFEEVSTVLFMLFNLKKRVSLIVTNNLSPDRFKNHPKYKRLILKISFKLAKKIFVHSNYEYYIIKEKFNILEEKIIIKPFHQIGIKRKLIPIHERKKYVLFIGPVRDNRPINPFLDLIKADTNKRNNYYLTKVSKLDFKNYEDLLSYSNVIIEENFLEAYKYYELISNAEIIVLTHNKYFEGRLSGVLCDAIATYTPIITANIHPNIEYFDKYGKIGFIVDFNNTKWFDIVINQKFYTELKDFYNIIEKIKADNRSEEIVNVVLNAIESK